MKLLFDKNRARVSFNVEGSNFIAEGEATHITNVIYNLLDNALKYSPENPEIKVSLKESAGKLILSVQDNGVGIAAEYKNRVFEKFFRVPTGDVHNIKGYGLGLNYVLSIMKAHDGTVEVESEPGKGSNFIITFPQTV
jgi:signal transduction histidine kinase